MHSPKCAFTNTVADTAGFKHVIAELHVSFQQSHAYTLLYHENEVICKFILLSSSTNIQFCKTFFTYELQRIHFIYYFQTAILTASSG